MELPQTPTIESALAWGRQMLRRSPAPAVDARLLLQHVLAAGHTELVSRAHELLGAEQVQEYRALVERAAQGEPIPYLTGQAPFYGREFKVTPAVLIPRPETEELVRLALDWTAARPAGHALDVGTGSGCIAITLACERPQWQVTAVDISVAALAVARHNAARHGVAQRITFYQGDLLHGLDRPVDLLLANLPYVSDTEWGDLDDGVKWYEPAGALRGGADGLDVIGRLLPQARSRMRPGGALFLEIGWRQGRAARELARREFPEAEVRLLPDLAGHDRFVTIQLR